MLAAAGRVPAVSRTARIVGLVTVAGAILRFATLSTQGFWLDEAVTADLMDRSLRGMLRGVSDGESTPYLYYLVSWGWAQVLGTGEAALRALPALLGTLTIPLVALLARRVAGDRAAILAAVLAAVCPLLVWYAQEARAYALLMLLATASVLLLLRADERSSPGRLAAWALTAALAIATHWFAHFLVAGEAVWLLWATRGRRGAWVAAGAVALAAAALLPLLISQRDAGRAGFIGEDSLAKRVAQIPKQLAIGYDAPAENALAALALLLLALAAAGLVVGVRRGAGERRALGAVLVAAGAALGLPLLAAAAGNDFVLTRNVLAALPLLVALAGAGFALLPHRAPGIAAAVALAAVWLVAVLAVATTARYQRDDWRGAARALGSAARPRVVVVAPASGRVPAAHYLGHGAREATAPVRVREIDVLAVDTARGGGRTAPAPAAAPAPGFTPAGERSGATWRVQRFTAPQPVAVDPAALAAGGAVLVQP